MSKVFDITWPLLGFLDQFNCPQPPSKRSCLPTTTAPAVFAAYLKALKVPPHICLPLTLSLFYGSTSSTHYNLSRRRRRPRYTHSQTPITQTLQLSPGPNPPPSHREHPSGSENAPLVEIYRMGETIWYDSTGGPTVGLSEPSI